MKNELRTLGYVRAGITMVGAAALLLGGCAAVSHQELVNEAGRPAASVVTHCSGSEWMDNSMVAVVPIPLFAFASPTQEINEIRADDVLRRCGPPERLVNRRVEVGRGACIPTVLTRLISLGVWHWCPANVSWDADVTGPPAATASMEPAPGASAAAPPPRAGVTRTESSEY